MQTKDIPLHDIKPLIEIQEYSIYYFSGLVFIAFVVIIGLGYLAYKYIQNRNSFNIRAEHLKLLKQLDLSDAKKAAYEVTHYGATFAQDSEQHQRTYENLVDELQRYKYKKNVEAFEAQTKEHIDNYIGMLDV